MLVFGYNAALNLKFRFYIFLAMGFVLRIHELKPEDTHLFDV